MEAQRLKAGIIGLGFIGGADQVSGDALGQKVSGLDGTHLEALSNHPRVDLLGGSSRDGGRRQRFTERTGLQTFADWQDLISQLDLDIVSVATYTPVHAEITLACVAAGARVIYCEKPIATTLIEAEHMVSACEEAGALLVINHNRRFSLNARRLRDHVTSGGLGKLTSAALQWSGGRLGNVGTHMFDTLRMLTGREVCAVSGTLDQSEKPDCRGPSFKDPGGWGILKLEGNTIVTVDAVDYGLVPYTIVINGSKGRATLDGDDIHLEYWDGTAERWPSQQKGASGMDIAVKEIVEYLDGAPFAYPGIEGVKTLEVIVGFHASDRRGAAWTSLPLSGDDREIPVHSG